MKLPKTDPCAEYRVSEDLIFIWIDILGFSEIVEDEEKYPDLYDKLEKFQRDFEKDEYYETHIISDGILLQIHRDKVSKIKDIFRYLAFVQWEFIQKTGYFIRGGIAVGTKFESKEQKTHTQQFISNGLAKAVKTEERDVSWPVIAITSKSLEHLRSLLGIPRSKENFNLMSGFNIKGDEIYFIDFIQDSSAYCGILSAKMNEYSVVPKVRNKYIWLIRYYVKKYGSGSFPADLSPSVMEAIY